MATDFNALATELQAAAANMPAADPNGDSVLLRFGVVSPDDLSALQAALGGDISAEGTPSAVSQRLDGAVGAINFTARTNPTPLADGESLVQTKTGVTFVPAGASVSVDPTTSVATVSVAVSPAPAVKVTP